MWIAPFRSGILLPVLPFSRYFLLPALHHRRPSSSTLPLPFHSSFLPLRFTHSHPPSSSLTSTSDLSSSMERQFEGFRSQLEDSSAIRDRIREVVVKMESSTRLMQYGILRVHESPNVAQVVEKAGAQIGILRELFGQLAEILRDCPGQYYRYHGDWRSETQSAVSLIAFLHWLETGNLLLHHEAEEKLGLSADFCLDVEDYLIGLCFMSNDLVRGELNALNHFQPRYVVNQVTAGDYDCPNRVLKFLTDLHAAFRMLNLRNDFLRKKIDSLKYDLRKVEEVFYDVKIRGLATSNPANGKETQPTESAIE